MIGIDPGLDGAVAVLPDGLFYDVPTVRVGKRREYAVPLMADILRGLADGAVAAVEGVHAMPGQGVTSMFRLGYGLGLWVGLLAGLGVPYHIVPPQRWRRAIVGSAPGKGAARLRAMELYPRLARWLERERDSGRADALLLAEYLRREVLKCT